MTLHYYPETDSLYIELQSGPGVETVEVRDGLNVDVDRDGRVVGIDLDRAAARFDLSRVETVGLSPVQVTFPEGVRGEGA
ncbi:MAG: DUF2283 domain-containing protein [Rhodospirillales bacterium]|nr:DUF2283 domain-containing protein [Rhodospirillales bacterium]